MYEQPDWRPDPILRATSTRRTPAVVAIRTCYSYHRHQCGDCVGAAPQVAQYRSEVTDFGEFDVHSTDHRCVGDVFQRMVCAFGDDADLEVIVRRRDTTTPPSPETAAAPTAGQERSTDRDELGGSSS